MRAGHQLTRADQEAQAGVRPPRGPTASRTIAVSYAATRATLLTG